MPAMPIPWEQAASSTGSICLLADGSFSDGRWGACVVLMPAGDPHGQPIATLWWGGRMNRLHLDAILGNGHSGLAESLALFFAMAVARCAPVFIRHVHVILDQTGWANTWRRPKGPFSRNPTTTAVHALAASVVQKVAWGFDALEVDRN